MKNYKFSGVPGTPPGASAFTATTTQWEALLAPTLLSRKLDPSRKELGPSAPNDESGYLDSHTAVLLSMKATLADLEQPPVPSTMLLRMPRY